MAVAFRAKASAGVTGTSLVVDKPTGTLDDDVMLAFIAVRPDGTTVTPPTGWESVLSQGRGANGELYVYRKVARSEGANYTFTVSASSQHLGVIASFSGGDIVTPVNVSGGSDGASASQVAPDVTTTAANTLVIRFCQGARNGAAATYTWPTSTEQWDDSYFDSGANVSIFCSGATATQAAAGATGTETATCSQNTSYASATIALIPQRPRLLSATGAGI